MFSNMLHEMVHGKHIVYAGKFQYFCKKIYYQQHVENIQHTLQSLQIHEKQKLKT